MSFQRLPALPGLLLACLALLTAIPVYAGLRDYSAAYYTPIGSVADGSLITANADNGSYCAALAGEFNLTGCENDLKMYIWKGYDTNADKPIINFTNADAVAGFALSNGMSMRGHCLVYNAAVPGWLKSSSSPTNIASPYTDNQIQHMVKVYITTLMQHFDTKFPGVIQWWDVTNEDFDGNGNLSPTMYGGNPDFWYAHLGGSNYFTNIFSWARSAVPACKLYYNDYGTEYPGKKFNGMLAFLKKLRGQGWPIDGLGFQSHENTGSPTNILTAANAAAVDAAGMEWQVTELDVQISNANPTANDWNTQNTIYSKVSNVCLNDPNCTALMMWGFTDKYSWLRPANGDIYDTNYVPKTGYYALDYRYIHAPNALNQTYAYTLINQNSLMAAEIEGNSINNGGNVDQWTSVGDSNQKWKFVSDQYGYYHIINQNSGLAMEVSGSSTSNGANVDQWEYLGDPNQQWTIVPVSDTACKIINRNSGQALDVYGARKTLNDNIDQWPYKASANQLWILQ